MRGGVLAALPRNDLTHPPLVLAVGGESRGVGGDSMQLSQLRTVDVFRPGVGKRYSLLPVDHVDITGFHVSYDGSPLQPTLLDIAEGDLVSWHEQDGRYQAFIDEIVIDRMILRVAFRDVQPADPEW